MACALLECFVPDRTITQDTTTPSSLRPRLYYSYHKCLQSLLPTHQQVDFSPLFRTVHRPLEKTFCSHQWAVRVHLFLQKTKKMRPAWCGIA